MKDIILFDGDCKLCNKSVDFVVRRDPKKHFCFASIQSAAGKELLEKVGALEARPQEVAQSKNDETIYLIEGNAYYTKSTAALRIARKLRFPWKLLYAGIIVPPFIRNAVYDFVGQHRKKWFGVTHTCDARMEPVEQDRFLD